MLLGITAATKEAVTRDGAAEKHNEIEVVSSEAAEDDLTVDYDMEIDVAILMFMILAVSALAVVIL